MAKTFFEFEDADGDVITVETCHSERPDDTVFVDASENGVYLTRSAVDRLRAALAPYGTVEAAKPADVIEVGREYRLLPGATVRVFSGERQAGIVSTGATRVRVDYRPDSYGDFSVTALDGTDAGNPGWFVNPAYLAPLTDPTDAAVATLRVKLTEAEATLTELTPSLDPRRVAAIDKAAAILTEHFDEVDTVDVQSVAAFLLGEAV